MKQDKLNDIETAEKKRGEARKGGRGKEKKENNAKNVEGERRKLK